MDAEIADYEVHIKKTHRIFAELSLITISGNVLILQKTLEEIIKAHKVQEVERLVHDTILGAPSVADQISPKQAAELFIGAVAEAAKLNPELPVLVVINGLDETNSVHLYDTATIFSDLFKGLSTYPNAKVMIASRTEQHIHKPFTKTLTKEHVKLLHLYTEDSVAEVRDFIRTRLKKVAEKYDLDPTFWPGKEHEKHLSDHAAEILDVTYDEDDTTEQDLERFRRIVGAILVAWEPLTIIQLDDLLDLSYSGNCVDMLNFVKLLRTVLVSGMDSVSEKTILRVHKSFFEFVTANSEAPFRVDLALANGEMTVCCLMHLAKSYAVIASAQFASVSADIIDLPHSTRYALDYCLSHAPWRDGQMLGIVLNHPDITLSQFNETLISCSSNALPLSIRVQHHPSIINTSLHSHLLIWDIVSSSPTRFVDISTNNPYQVVTSPNGKYLGAGDIWIDLSDIETAQEMEVCASADGIWICDTRTGHFKQRVHAPLSPLLPVVLSPGGSWILSSTYTDHALIIWDYFSGQQVGERFIGHTQEVISTAFSPNSKYILSCDSAARLWDVEFRQQVGDPIIGIDSVSFSPDGSFVLLTSPNGFEFREVPTMRKLAHITIPLWRRKYLTFGAMTPDGQCAFVTQPTGDAMSIFNISPQVFHIKNTLHLKWSALSIPKGNLFVYLGSENTLFLSRLDPIRYVAGSGNGFVQSFKMWLAKDTQHLKQPLFPFCFSQGQKMQVAL
ncbi:hypothetical protein H0H87_012501 [Tephrocybe sp. NHM501043]|nr:hypothetical protein H0H87_012501 [Tephrocybe sp. NHM501043]